MNQLRQITVRIQMRFQLFAHQHMRINALMNAAEYEWKPVRMRIPEDVDRSMTSGTIAQDELAIAVRLDREQIRLGGNNEFS